MKATVICSLAIALALGFTNKGQDDELERQQLLELRRSVSQLRTNVTQLQSRISRLEGKVSRLKQ